MRDVGDALNRRLIEARARNQRRNDGTLRIVREILAEVDDLWLAQWTPSRGLPQPDRLREIARDLASYEDTSAKRAMQAIVKGLAE